jgi:hypothetical protein
MEVRMERRLEKIELKKKQDAKCKGKIIDKKIKKRVLLMDDDWFFFPAPMVRWMQ